MGIRLGIDFGTSNTVAMVARPDGRVRPLLFDGSEMLPSAVCADPEAGLLVGRDAVHAARARPECFEPHPKRRIDDGVVLLGPAEVPVMALIAAVLGRVAAEARRTADGDIASVVLTHPAGWGSHRRQVLLDAAAVAGFATPALVAEPVAAASYFVAHAGGRVSAGSCVVVYDFGAGTFDATVVRRGPWGFEVLASEGLTDAGGLDVDAALVAHLGAVHSAGDGDVWRRLVEPRTAEDRRANRVLWDDVRAGKEMLSRRASTLIHLPLLDRDAPLGREQFDHLATPVLTRTVTATRAVVRSAGVDPTSIAAVFLVGGSSRMPLVATLLHRGMGIAPTAIEQPELVVAEGSLHATPLAPPTETDAVPEITSPWPLPAHALVPTPLPAAPPLAPPVAPSYGPTVVHYAQPPAQSPGKRLSNWIFVPGRLAADLFRPRIRVHPALARFGWARAVVMIVLCGSGLAAYADFAEVLTSFILAVATVPVALAGAAGLLLVRAGADRRALLRRLLRGPGLLVLIGVVTVPGLPVAYFLLVRSVDPDTFVVAFPAALVGVWVAGFEVVAVVQAFRFAGGASDGHPLLPALTVPTVAIVALAGSDPFDSYPVAAIKGVAVVVLCALSWWEFVVVSRIYGVSTRTALPTLDRDPLTGRPVWRIPPPQANPAP